MAVTRMAKVARPSRGSKPGERRGGRQKGTPNKTTTVVKEGILRAYAGIGGDKAFATWAEKNPGEFYTKVLTKVLPHELRLGDADGNKLEMPQIVRLHTSVDLSATNQT